MTRWHTPTCVSPDVTFSNDNWPNCGTCGRSCPPLEELLTSSQASNGASALQFPVERPQGRMNLYWPPCVPYKRTHSSSHPGDIGSEMVVPVRKSVSKSSNTLDPLYGKTLDKTEFRVACLLAPIHENVPVHVSLETFSDDSHPEYETVSYIWGGENGDNSLRRPIFIGSYWDVLLQTENCWSMLRSIRPNRGERLVWVDALCINQQNLEERTSQVAKMRRIYEQCSRVIAYLGNDLVTQSKPFPQYRPLYELHKASKDNELFPDGHPHHAIFLGLHQLLRRKYFTRIWIIQELLLPERIVFRIGDTEFRADSTIISRITNYHLKSPTWWSTTAAPWVQYIAQKRIPTQHSICDTFEVLRFSRKSHASDPRDRFFGIVALLSNERIQRDLAPDYSISYQHFCIGLFTHWIVNQRAYGLLYKARTLLNPDPCAPSWLPICNSSKAWNDILE
ncbi:heterokaryon incompatibility protein-domain-containing protein, partial [Paraphoma chrysanthemicola]